MIHGGPAGLERAGENVVKNQRPRLLPRSPASTRRRIFVLDDHPIMRYGLKQLLNREPDLMVSGEAGEAEEALATLEPPLPDLVLADVGLPGKSVEEFLEELRARHPAVPVLILSTHDETLHAERLMRAGARGYIMKSEGGAHLLKAIRQVMKGETYLSRAMMTKLSEGRASLSKPSA